MTARDEDDKKTELTVDRADKKALAMLYAKTTRTMKNRHRKEYATFPFPPSGLRPQHTRNFTRVTAMSTYTVFVLVHLYQHYPSLFVEKQNSNN